MRRQSRCFIGGDCFSSSIFGHFDGQEMNVENAKLAQSVFTRAIPPHQIKDIICSCSTHNRRIAAMMETLC
jgi:hypothetical protein